MRVKKMLLGFAMAALSVSATQVLAAGCPAKGAKELTGAGATFPYPLYSKMLSEYDKACGVKVNYQSIGSGGGIRQLQEQTVDFGASDGVMDEKQKAQAQAGAVLHIPTVVGIVAIAYNLPQVRQPLKLSGP